MREKKWCLIIISPGGASLYRYNQHAFRSQFTPIVMNHPLLALVAIASVTPEEWDVHVILDEGKITPEMQHDADIVAISISHSIHARRAYEIARFFRSRGVTVVFGGTHVTLGGYDALAYGDAVVIGEAEKMWQKVLQDFQAGTLERIYKSPGFADLTHMPLLRWDRMPFVPYYGLVQFTRGCPNGCDFCSVGQLFGRHIRTRPIEHIMNDIRQFPSRKIWFVDDNLFAADHAVLEELFAELKKEKVQWAAMATIDIYTERALLEKAYDAGCQTLFCGFDVAEPRRYTMFRGINYTEAITSIRDIGISVHASVVVGNDDDTTEVFDHIVDFVEENNLTVVNVWILTPYPTGPIFKKISDEKRFVDMYDYSLFDAMHASFHTKHFRAEELEREYVKLIQRIYALPLLHQRLCRLWEISSLKRKDALLVKIGVYLKAFVLCLTDIRAIRFIIKMLPAFMHARAPIESFIYSLDGYDYAYKRLPYNYSWFKENK